MEQSLREIILLFNELISAMKILSSVIVAWFFLWIFDKIVKQF